MYLASLKHNLAGLLRFSGRSSRRQFWPYAVTAFALALVGLQVVMVPMIAGSMTRMQQLAMSDPANVTETIGPGSYSISVRGDHPELMPDFGALMPMIALILVPFVLLLAAAVTRRLHDRGWRGWWALVPLVFLCSGMIMMQGVFTGLGRDDQAMQGVLLLGLNNMVYLATLLALVIVLAYPGTPGPNRFGEPPAS